MTRVAARSLLFLLFTAALAGCAGGPSTRELRQGLLAAGYSSMSSEAVAIQVTEMRKCQPPYPEGLAFRNAGENIDPGTAGEVWYVEYTTCTVGDCLDAHTIIGSFPDQGFKWGPWLAEDPTTSSAPVCD